MLSIIVPVYNEENSIVGFHRQLTDTMAAQAVECEIVYVNDGSTDGSAEILKGLGGCRVITHAGNRGYGAAIKSGIMHSTMEWIAIIDCDGTYSVDDLVKLLSHKDENDMIVGQRPREKGLRRISKGILTAIASYAVSYTIPDLNSGLRLLRRKVSDRLIHMLPNGFSLTSTITLGALYVPFRVAYVPIGYKKRVGKSKIRPLDAMVNFTLLIFRMIILFNPLRFFLPVFFTMMGGGLAFLVRDIINQNIAQTSLLLITNSFIVLAVGLLAEAIVYKNP
jgi:glycosyltransferase involved in cell wall biosynthesis